MQFILYCGYVTTLHGLRKHSNADRLQCVEVFGQNVIVDLSYHEGQKVVFFPSDGCLSEEFANDNNLVRKKDEHGNNIGGYMNPEKRNITAIRLRGEKSEGLVLPIEVLNKYVNANELPDGTQITKLNGHEIGKKYIDERRINISLKETDEKLYIEVICSAGDKKSIAIALFSTSAFVAFAIPSALSVAAASFFNWPTVFIPKSRFIELCVFALEAV